METTTAPLAKVELWRTDAKGKDSIVSGGGFIGNPPRSIPSGGGTIDIRPSATFTFPADPRWPDVHQRVTKLDKLPPPTPLNAAHGTALAEEPTSLEANDLMIESISFNATTSEYALVDIFGTIGAMAGKAVPVRIPDLFADTNGDGMIGEGDILYSLVDLQQFLLAPPSFSMSDHFTIVNGTVATLPGMWFSTTPFTFSPSGGFTPTSLASLAAGGFSGDSVVDAIHTLTAIPEPRSWALIVGGFGLVGGAIRLRRKARVRPGQPQRG